MDTFGRFTIEIDSCELKDFHNANEIEGTITVSASYDFNEAEDDIGLQAGFSYHIDAISFQGKNVVLTRLSSRDMKTVRASCAMTVEVYYIEFCEWDKSRSEAEAEESYDRKNERDM